MDFTKPQKLQFVWCIGCQEEVIMDLNTLDGMPVHTVCYTDGDEYGCETFIEPCFGPFASCPPPDNFEIDWDLIVEEPDGDEMLIINRNAEQLLADFESENKK